MKSVYPVILTKAERGYVVTVPDLDINTEGDNLVDAIEMARDAIGMYGICQQDLGKEIPEAKNLNPAHADDEILSIVDIDFEQYRRAQDMKTERTNVTVQAYLLREARKRKINVSAVLQDALRQQLGM